jgi:RimJ/RimL family protein N-acetyltransferase
LPRFPDLDRPIEGTAVLVRLGAERDIPEILIAYQDDPELHVRLGRPRPPSGAELGRLAERAESDRAAGRSITWTILEPGSDICRGQVYADRIDWENLRAELRVWVAPQARRRGLASGALARVGEWLLGEGGLERVQVQTEIDNEPMIGCARAAGFTYEGVLRGYTRERSSRVDNVVLSMVRRDLAG